MSRLEVPLAHRVHPLTGDLLLGAELDLLLKDAAGGWRPERFRVDTGSDITTMPAWRAKALTLPMPQRPVFVPLGTTTGTTPTEVRSGILRLRVDGMDPTEYAVPCFFLGDPDHAPAPGTPAATVPRKLLGLGGVVDKLRFTFDGTPVSAAAPHGLLTVEKI